MKYYTNHKTMLMENKKKVLVQKGNKFYVLMLHCEIEEVHELAPFLNKNDVRILREKIY